MIAMIDASSPMISESDGRYRSIEHHLLCLSLTKYTKAVYTKLQCPQHTENFKMTTFPLYLRMMIVIADDDGR